MRYQDSISGFAAEAILRKDKIIVKRKGKIHYRMLKREPKNGKGISCIDIMIAGMNRPTALYDLLEK